MSTTNTDAPRILLLGPVDLGPTGPRLTGTKQRLVLALLARQPGTPVSVDRLIEALWDDDLPQDAAAALQVHVSKLRGVLDAVDGLDAAIEHRAGAYALRVAAEQVDLVRFERLVERGSAQVDSHPGDARPALADALDLWRGEPFGDLADHAALRADARRLEDLWLHAHATRAEAALALGDHAAVIGDLRSLTDAHPLREDVWTHLIVALYRSGRQADALSAYERARRSLADELGVDPSPALRDLHRRLLEQDPALDGPSPTGTWTPPVARAHGDAPAASLAVLPFQVIGDTGDAVPLAAGLHNDLISELSGARGLTVISRTSVLGYAHTNASVRAVASELGVSHVLEGSLQVAGSRFRLSVRLIVGEHDATHWVGSYDDEVTAENLFAIQADLAAEIAGSLSAKLLPAPGTAGRPATPTTDLDAYRLVALARAQFDLKTEEGLANAVATYEQAARLDPTYVDALAGLAMSLVSAYAYGHGDRHDLLSRAEQAVHRALGQAPDSPAARTALGVLHVAYQDGPAAITELERARDANPGHADPHNWLCWVHLLTGDAEAGRDAGSRAAELDPRAAEVRAHLALVHAANGDPAAGATEARLASQLSPYTTAVLYEAICRSELGDHEHAVELLEPLQPRPGEPLPVPWAGAWPQALLSVTLATSGRTDEAREIAASVDHLAHPFATGLIQLGLGDVDAATSAFSRVSHLTAWPCLALHHFHAALWRRLDGTPCLAELRAVAHRSWRVSAG